MNTSKRVLSTRIGIRWKSTTANEDDTTIVTSTKNEIDVKDGVKRARFVAADIEKMLKKSTNIEAVTVPEKKNEIVEEKDESDIAPKMRENASVTDKIQGRRASQIMKWYTESRIDRSGGDQSSIVRVKNYFGSAEYINATDSTETHNNMWVVYNFVLLASLGSLFWKVMFSDSQRYFHEILDDRRNEIYYSFHEFSDKELEADVLRKYGWWFNWRNTNYSAQRENLTTFGNNHSERDYSNPFSNLGLNAAVMRDKWLGF